MAQQFKNNARALLVAGISDTDTSFVVESAKADLFPVANTGANPVPAATDWFKVTLQNASGAVEIVAVRTRAAGSGIMSNVLRAQDGTTALNFLAGTVVGLRITADDVQTALGLPGQNNTFSGNNTFVGTNSFAGSVSGQGLINLLYPVGSVYINATNNTNPGTLFGVGTWTAFGAGRVPVGFDSGNSLFNSAEETGGSYDATLPSHSHGFSGSTGGAGSHSHSVNDPGHVHALTSSTGSGIFPGLISVAATTNTNTQASATGISINGVGDHAHSVSGSVAASGSSATNANIQPYITVFMWKRTA
jgi:hypothetical protein